MLQLLSPLRDLGPEKAKLYFLKLESEFTESRCCTFIDYLFHRRTQHRTQWVPSDSYNFTSASDVPVVCWFSCTFVQSSQNLYDTGVLSSFFRQGGCSFEKLGSLLKVSKRQTQDLNLHLSGPLALTAPCCLTTSLITRRSGEVGG